jgi:hypothetical protein
VLYYYEYHYEYHYEYYYDMTIFYTKRIAQLSESNEL